MDSQGEIRGTVTLPLQSKDFHNFAQNLQAAISQAFSVWNGGFGGQSFSYY